MHSVTASAFHKLPSIYVFSYFPFGFEGRMWDLIASVPVHCLSFYLAVNIAFQSRGYLCSGPHGNPMNSLIRLIFRLIIFNVFIQSLN